MPETRKFKCYNCGNTWELPYGTGRPERCPNCGSNNIHRDEEDRGPHRRRRGLRDREKGS